VDKNQLYYDDNLDVLRKYIDAESVDLCYIDPPFNSKRNYNQIYNNIGTEDRAQAQAFTDTWEWDDMATQGLQELSDNPHQLYTMQTVKLMHGLLDVLGRGSLLAYLVSMTLRIAEIHRVLKPTGSFYLHCDPTADAYLRLVADSIFCPRGGKFRNEIIWSYKTGGASKIGWSKKHDVILFYTKSKDCLFNTLKEKNYTKSKNRKAGIINYGAGNAEFFEDEKGVYNLVNARDVWEISYINSMAKERFRYPTQKPEKLLERIILASSNEGDTVLDAYCGCGTTVAVAQRLNRKWIGIDITYASISLILERLEKTYGAEIVKAINLNGIPKDAASAKALSLKKDDRTRKEFEKWAILTYSNNHATINDKKGKDYGIDGIAYMATGNDTSKKVYFSVKSGHVTSAQVRDLRGAIERDDAAAGIFITLQPPTKDMLQEAKAAGTYQNELSALPIERIKIVTIEQIMQGERMYLPLANEVLKHAQRKIITTAPLTLL
jgi:site-specific DNA-methyltransferase (adenine-specific)